MFNPNIAIIEIRSAAGGDEAKIWADDLLRLYFKYAEKNNFTVNIITDNTLKIKGSDVFNQLKYEAGVHRVQRVPATEKRGRIHTSTATVSVLPQIDESQVNINPADLEWQFYRASSQGGQNVQKVSTAVRLIHKPSGLVVTCQTERFQEQNRKIALDLLRAKLWEEEQGKRQDTLNDYRLAIGRGMRSEKIRTYNFPQNRVTDHRINKSFHNLDKIMEGELDKIIAKLAENKQ
jgi:peptide chain release factor 1